MGVGLEGGTVDMGGEGTEVTQDIQCFFQFSLLFSCSVVPSTRTFVRIGSYYFLLISDPFLLNASSLCICLSLSALVDVQ